MNIVSNFQSFNESNNTLNWFYVVLQTPSKYNTDKNVWESLTKMEFNGLKGISDNEEIVNQWFDTRPIVLAMPAGDVMKMNNLHPIYYHNADQLISNNLEILIRILGNDKVYDNEIKYTNTIKDIFLNSKYPRIGNRKRSEIYGNWKKIPNKKYIRELIFSISSSDFANMCSAYISKRIIDGVKIKSVGHLSKLTSNFIEENREELLNIKYSDTQPFLKLIDHYDKYGNVYIHKILKWGISNIGDKYNNKEGEWLIKKDINGVKKLKVPMGSHLIIKEYINKEEWMSNLIEDTGSEYTQDYPGIRKEKVQEIIDFYNLDVLYKIHKVNNKYRGYELIRTMFPNK